MPLEAVAESLLDDAVSAEPAIAPAHEVTNTHKNDRATRRRQFRDMNGP